MDALDGFTKTSKLGHAVDERYRALGQDQHVMVIQHRELVERITADSVALASWPVGVPPILPESVLAIDIRNTNLKKTPWFLLGILYHGLNDDGQPNFLSNWGPNYEAVRKPRNSLPEEAISRHFAYMCRSMPVRYK